MTGDVDITALFDNPVFPSTAWIAGKPVSSVSERVFDVASPIDGKKLVSVPRCDGKDLDMAVGAAREAFDDGPWRKMTPTERKRALLRLADSIRNHAQELAVLETLDMGKPVSDSLGEMHGAADCIAWFAEAADKIYGETAPLGSRGIGIITREPIGVVAAVVPWNFPMVMACWKIAPALAAGNSVILKPSERSSLSALRLGELIAESDLPSGVFSVLTGYGNEIGQSIGLHPDIDAVGFTGSTATGKAFLRYAGQSNMKRVGLECGGKNPSIVFNDYDDMDYLVETLSAAIFDNQGEMCNAASRILVDRSVHDDLADRLSAAANRFAPSDPRNPESVTGALVDAQHLETVHGFVSRAKEDGYKLVTGGKPANCIKGGSYYPPTIFSGLAPDAEIAREEVFGPVLGLIPFATEDEAIKLANNSQYGLTASVWSSNFDKAHRVSQSIRAGTVWINTYHLNDMSLPFGGFRQSGVGRDKSLHAFEKVTELKATIMRVKER